ncbi:hypothetical protein UAW_02842 [Enterococcus haemoperoxidus ATCC BAA-382]|uniref:Uncharacterized protein n=1 Tax=Enterococcus haemoperoxidus ATCC BAA-382 TaxID=1158608 RepID=R2SIV7_9ENTE|nr:hypothetical protein [Enterococcus haemoperoxidus]EOH92801.1 hypothetical protein UAW_02842 [Enterococcus haemoperoxidus ATCC BAA-382]EOT61544.1 hypothetical protein I583_00526 [Enterococcus haemoperoxidus ATCC BAA-382]
MIYIQILIMIIFIVAALFAIASVFNAISVLLQVKKGNLDELEKKTVSDSLVYTMFVLLFLHLIQFILGMIVNFMPDSQFHYYPIISGGLPFREVMGNSPWHFEALFFDFLIFSIIYFFRKRKYRD